MTLKFQESDIGQLFTTDGKDVWEYTGTINQPIYIFKNLKVGNNDGHFTADNLPPFKRLIPEPRKYERKQVTVPPDPPQAQGDKPTRKTRIKKGVVPPVLPGDPIATFHIDGLNSTAYIGLEEFKGETLKDAVMGLFQKTGLANYPQ